MFRLMVIYFSDINTGNEVGLMPGRKLCFPAVATKRGQTADVAIGVKPSKHRFTIHYLADKRFLPTGQLMLAYACE